MSAFTVNVDVADEVLEFGVAAGLLRREAGNGAQLTVNTEFFGDPARHLAQALSEPVQRAAALGLLERLVEGTELTVDLGSVLEGETWIPITSSAQPAGGLYLVVRQSGNDVLLSLAGRIATENPQLQAGTTIAVPLVRVSGSTEGSSSRRPVEALIGSPDGTVRLAVTLSLTAGATGPVQLEGASIEVSVPTDGTSEPSLGVLLRGLRLPGEAVPRDVSLSEVGQPSGQAVKIFVALLRAQAGGLSDELQHLLALVGLHPSPPIPELVLDDVLHDGLAALRRWLAATLAAPGALGAWLGHLGALLGLPAGAIGGTGTQSDPFRLCAGTSSSFCLSLQVGTDPASGATTFTPGLTVSRDAGAGAPVTGRAYVAAELCAISLGPAASVRLLPSLRVAIQVGSATSPLVSIDTGTPREVRVGSLHFGLALDGDHRPGAVLEGHDIKLGALAYPVLDLGSAKAVKDAVDGALDEVAARLVDAVGAGDGPEAIPEAQALAALAGIRRPRGAPAGWPALVPLGDLFANPLEGIACYHVRVLEQEGAWSLLAAELGRILAAVTGDVAVVGSGTVAEPWSVTLFDNVGTDDPVRGALALEVWSSTAAGSSLHLAVRVAPEALAVGEQALSPSYLGELVRVDLPPSTACPGPISLAWVPSHALFLRFGEHLELETERLAVLAAFIEARLSWSEATGVRGSLRIEDPALRIDQIETPLPDLDFEPGAPLPPLDFDDLPWQELEWLAGQTLSTRAGDWGWRIASLLGWLSDLDELRLRLPQLPELTIAIPTADWPRLSLRSLLDAPAAALKEWWSELVSGIEGESEVVLPFVGWLSGLLTAPSLSDGDLLGAVSGTGSPQDPWVLSVGGENGPELLLWLEPDGPALGGFGPWAEHLIPDELLDALDGSAPVPSLGQLTQWLARAAAWVPELGEALGERGNLAAALEALHQRLAASDGLVRAAHQQPPADPETGSPPAGWTVVPLTTAVAHHRLPAQFVPDLHLPGGPQPTHCIFVGAPLPGVDPWPGEVPARIVDLTAPGLAADAFDLGAVSGPGPWFVRLPTRAAAAVAATNGTPATDGFDGLAARLRRVVEAAAAGAGAGELALIAHSSSGHAARRVAAERPDLVGHLVTLGTPHGGASFEFLDDRLAGEAIRLLQRLRAFATGSGSSAASAVLEPLLQVIDTLTAVVDDYVVAADGTPQHVPFPTTDFTAPAVADAAGVSAVAVVSSLAGADLTGGLAALVGAALERAVALGSGGDEGERPPPERAAAGIRMALASGGDVAGEVALDCRLRLEVGGIDLQAPTVAAAPRLAVRAELRRVDGWLVGGPGRPHLSGTPRDPRLRWAELELVATLDPLDAVVRVVLHDASVFGRHHKTLVIDRASLLGGTTSEPLPPEARILIGELARAAGPLSPTGAVRDFVEVLRSLALVEIAADETITVPADPLERFLVDPLGELLARLDTSSEAQAAVLSAVARVLGATPPEVPGGELCASLGSGFEACLSLGPPARLSFRSVPEGVILGDVVSLRGNVSIDSTGHVTSEVAAGVVGEPGPAGQASLVVSYDSEWLPPLRVVLETEGVPALRGMAFEIVGDSLELYPEPDLDGMLAYGLDRLTGEVLRVALEWALGPAAIAGQQLRDPLPLLRDPVGWLLHPAVLGLVDPDSRLRLDPSTVPGLVDAVRALLGLEGTPGTLPLPWGLVLTVREETGGRWAVRVEVDQPIDAGAVALAGWGELRVDAAGGLIPFFAATARFDDLPDLDGASGLVLDHVSLGVGFDGGSGTTTADLRLGRPPDNTESVPSEVVVRLLPAEGLGALAGLFPDVATEHVLPAMLDAVARATALTAAATATATTLTVASAEGFPASGPFQVKIGPETVVVTAGHGTSSWTVQRGADGTTAEPHAAGTTVALIHANAGATIAALALGHLGDALGLRRSSRFVADELIRFAKDPVGELVPRLRANADDALAAVDVLAALVLPSSAVEVRGHTLTVRPSPHASVSLDVPETEPLVLTAELTDISPIPGLEATVRARADQRGLDELTVALNVVGDLLSVESLRIRPFLQLLAGRTVTGSGRVEFGLWLPEPGAQALVVRIPFTGSVGVVCRPPDGPDRTDLGTCLTQVVRVMVVPLLFEQLLALQPLVNLLERDLAGTVSLGDVLVEAGVLARSGTNYDLDPDVLDVEHLRGRVLALGAQVVRLLAGLWPPPGPEPPPVRLSLATANRDGRVLYGLRAELPQGLELLSTNGVKVTLEAPPPAWIASGISPGVEVFILSTPQGAFDPAQIELRPWLRVLGLGVRVAGDGGRKLIDAAASLNAVAVHGFFDRDFGTADPAGPRAGGRILLDGFSIPLGRASGADNPVAAKLLSAGNGAGDRTELAPTLSPQLILVKEPFSPLRVRLRGADQPVDGPWFLQIQRKFGPIYVEQIGLDTEESAAGSIESVSLLVDAKASLAGLAVGLDDLSVTIPWSAPFDLSQWRLGLAGLAVAYQSPGVSLAGGLRRRRGTPPDYAGLLVAQLGEYGLTAVGRYAEYQTEVAGQTYTSLFIFAALSGPLGGPPPFFVTGVGAGAALNRRLVLPAEVTDVPSYPLVAAMDPQSPFLADPMAALDSLGTAFPPERGAYWFAAGVRFTSFALVESIAVLSVSMGRDLEVSLLGLSRATLPRPESPIAKIELALRAYFSSREAVLSVQAQLTDNSWLLNENCRLTGGFAFVIWFRTGQFVLTLGGYHPGFARKPEFPLVPRLGFNWAVSDDIVIKGEAYFALTSTCVMAGGRLEASYTSGAIWASFVVGMDAIVSWDPFFYDFTAYVQVRAGIEIRVCIPLLGCARKRLSLSLGAQAHVWGPKLRGEATLDLQVVSVTVRFGAHDQPESGREPIGWPEFREKYLVAGDPRDETMEASVPAGQLVSETSDAGTAANGEAGRPWRVGPEFTLVSRTRAASNRVNGNDLSGVTPQAIGLGPMHKSSVRSEHTMRVVDVFSGADVTSSLQFSPVVANVPEGVWRVLDDRPVPEANVRPAYTGGSLVSTITLTVETVRVALQLFDLNDPPHRLPFLAEQEQRGAFFGDVAAAHAYIDRQPTATSEILAVAADRLQSGFAGTAPSPLAALTFAADRVAAPQLAPLAEGMVAPVKPPVDVTPQEVPPPPPPPSDAIDPPRLQGVLRGSPPNGVRGARRTTAGPKGAGLPRVEAPKLLDEKQRTRGPGAGYLELVDPEPRRAQRTVVAADAGPPTSRAGGLLEARKGLRAAPEVADSVSALEEALHSGAAVRLTAGDIQVMTMPRAEFDTRPERPSFTLTGDQPVRVVALDRGGAVLDDASGEDFSWPLPQGTKTVAIAGVGKPDPELTVTEAGLAGWHAGTSLAQVAGDAYLGPRCVLRTTSPQTLRRDQPATAAVIRAADAVQGRGVVTTEFRQQTATVVVALETAEAIDELLSGLVLGLTGAERVAGTHGPRPPLAVVSGPRAYGLFAVISQPGGTVSVTVGSDERWSLAGVFAATAAPEEVAPRLSRGGLNGLLASVVTSPLGVSDVRWVGAP